MFCGITDSNALIATSDRFHQVNHKDFEKQLRSLGLSDRFRDMDSSAQERLHSEIKHCKSSANSKPQQSFEFTMAALFLHNNGKKLKGLLDKQEYHDTNTRPPQKRRREAVRPGPPAGDAFHPVADQVRAVEGWNEDE